MTIFLKALDRTLQRRVKTTDKGKPFVDSHALTH